ncbi:hypothetical protein [Streptomyces sp. NPDC048266]|uniref:hypothetical protein n=1 Tax=Streptomyces sp. NPDC048266 TaxID=3155787 RepID=UPI0033C64036
MAIFELFFTPDSTMRPAVLNTYVSISPDVCTSVTDSTHSPFAGGCGARRHGLISWVVGEVNHCLGEELVDKVLQVCPGSLRQVVPHDAASGADEEELLHVRQRCGRSLSGRGQADVIWSVAGGDGDETAGHEEG